MTVVLYRLAFIALRFPKIVGFVLDLTLVPCGQEPHALGQGQFCALVRDLTFALLTDKPQANSWVRVLENTAMSLLLLEKLGYLLWEGLVFVCVITGALGLVMLRRKLGGRPVFSNADWNLLFNTPPAAVSIPKLCLRFGLAVVLFCGIGAFEVLVLEQFGAAILSASLLLSCAGIINITFL